MSNKRYEVNTPGVSPVDRDVTKLLYVSTAKYGGDWHSLMHTHACTELFYVVGGMGQFKVAEKLIPVSPDDLVIVNPNGAHGGKPERQPAGIYRAGRGGHGIRRGRKR